MDYFGVILRSVFVDRSLTVPTLHVKSTLPIAHVVIHPSCHGSEPAGSPVGSTQRLRVSPSATKQDPTLRTSRAAHSHCPVRECLGRICLNIWDSNFRMHYPIYAFTTLHNTDKIHDMRDLQMTTHTPSLHELTPSQPPSRHTHYPQ